MTKNRLVAFYLLLTMFAMPVSANVTLYDFTTPKDLYFRLGTTDTPENQIDVSVKEEPAIIPKKENLPVFSILFAL